MKMFFYTENKMVFMLFFKNKPIKKDKVYTSLAKWRSCLENAKCQCCQLKIRCRHPEFK